jgi:hypothetical protein
MKKLLIPVTFVLLFIILFPSIARVQATNYNYSLSYAPNHHVDDLDNDPYEAEVTNDVVEYIDNLFTTYGLLQYLGDHYTDASPSDYTYGLFVAEASSNIENVAFFSKGHICQYTCAGNTVHYALIAHGNNEFVNDTVISDYTGGKIKLAVIWHCGTAQGYTQYDDMYCTSCGSYYSMPMAFTKNNGMSMDGYDYPNWGSPYVFLGFEGYSPQFLSNWGLNEPWYYYHVAANIYYMLVWAEFNFNDAVDQTCYESSGDWFPYHWFGEFHQNWDPDGEGFLTPCDTQTKILGNGEANYPGYPW